MFDVIGKRRWYFAFSLLITIPGLIFILLTPFSGGKAGLKFSIDYTGGTTWSIRFADPNVTAAQVREELVNLGQADATVALTGAGFFDIRLSKLDLRVPEPSPTPVPTLTAAPSSSASAGPTASTAPTAPGPSTSPDPAATPTPAPTPTPSPTPEPTATPTPVPSPTATAPPVGNTHRPDGRQRSGEIATGLQDALGPIAEQRSLTSIGAVVSSDLINQAIILILVGSARDPRLDHATASAT